MKDDTDRARELEVKIELTLKKKTANQMTPKEFEAFTKLTDELDSLVVLLEDKPR